VLVGILLGMGDRSIAPHIIAYDLTVLK
jgi:hypothetical protein